MTQNKLLTVTIPCYNSQDYMEHCLQTVLSGGEDVEILIVDDGSTDGTAAIADRWQEQYPTIVRAIHQSNGGHGAAVMTGIRNATGLYFKVVDSDDWVDESVFQKILDRLRSFEQPIDLLISNYIYDKPSCNHLKEIHYKRAFKENRLLSWDEVRRFRPWENLLMHALIYRTEVLRQSGLELPRHTFYVDNLYCTIPLVCVRTLYYMDVGLYHYFIGRDGQSIQEDTMIRRIDQQIRVNKLLMEGVDLEHVENPRCRQTIFHYHDTITAVTGILLILAGTPEHLAMRDEFWAYVRDRHPWEYRKLRRSIFGIAMNLPGKAGRALAVFGYRIAKRIFNFN